ncbi:MAG: AMP-dependent synthetase/ligase [Actinomycetaceae bacterium]|nr:AMP-dependent synthetase/ligase [Actinomycetaceae bacterium]
MARASKSQTFSAPMRRHASDDHTVFTFLDERARRRPSETVMERRREVGGWRQVSGQQLLREVDECARGLLGLGLKTGDRMAIMSVTRPEWTILDIAALSIGVVVVPIYESDSLSQIEWITKKTQPLLAVSDTRAREQLLRHGTDASVRHILCLEGGGMRTISQAGLAVSAEDLEQVRAQVKADDIATVIFTSGTTGNPKGVVLTHRNFVETVYAVHEMLPQIALSPKTRFLLFLPLAHVLARFVQIAILSGRGVFAHTSDTRNLMGDLESFQPSLLLLVPRVLEKVYNSAEAKAGKGKKRQVFHWAARSAISFSRALETKLGPSAAQRRQLAWAQRLVLNKIRKALGPNLRYIISGGAPLSPTLGHFFRGLGYEVVEGWGLSETTGPMTLGRLGEVIIGSVGQVLPGNEVQVNAEGEILVRGNAVFQGYFADPEATAEVVDEDGWFNTGDLGRFDRKGNLFITGRSKDLIVTAGGKNVSPAALEETLVTHPLISHVVVVGDQRPYVGALITLDAEMLPTWLANHDLPAMDPARAAQEPRVLESLDKAIKRSNRNVARAESIRRFRIINAEFTVDNGYLTPSLKLKRAAVAKDFAHEIDALYAEGEAQKG